MIGTIPVPRIIIKEGGGRPGRYQEEGDDVWGAGVYEGGEAICVWNFDLIDYEIISKLMYTKLFGLLVINF